MRARTALLALLLVVSPAAATVMEFNEGHHAGDTSFQGSLVAADLWADGDHWPDNQFQLTAESIQVQTAETDTYIATEGGQEFAGVPEHSETTFHHAVVTAIPNQQTTYLAIHDASDTHVKLHAAVATSTPPSDETYTDVQFIQLQEPRTSDIGGTLAVAADDHVDATLAGNLSSTFWGWTVQITSDEGTYEYQTGLSHDAEAGSASVGHAMQIQMVAKNAVVEVTGNYDEVGDWWIRDAVAESDRMDLKLSHDNDLPTDQEVFTERSHLTVLAVTDTVSADVVPVPLPSAELGATPGPEDAAEPIDTDNATAGITGATDSSGQSVHGAVAPDPGMSSMPLWAWILVTFSMVVVGVFFIVRQMIGWPVGTWFMTKARDLHEDMHYLRATVVATIGHWLRPMDARHRYYRGIARVDRGHDHSALRDLLWAQKRFTNLPEYRAEASYQAARIAARLHRPGIAGDMVAKASRVDESYLWCAVKDKELCRLAGHPEFETFLALGLNARPQ